MSDDRGRDAGGSIDRYATLAQAVIAVASALALIFTVADRFAGNTTALIDVGIGALVVLYLVSVLWVARAMLRTRYYDFRIALTGQPGAGKTVFANLLYDRLMNGGDPDYRFTAESRSAIATYQAIRGISQDEWPPSTARGSVLQRDGLLRHRRAVVDLEIGDSAGQRWLSSRRRRITTPRPGTRTTSSGCYRPRRWCM